MMTRKDYVATANILNNFKDEMHFTAFEDLVNEFSEFFEADNPRFDAIRFAEACSKESALV
jgi:hypothetical protein